MDRVCRSCGHAIEMTLSRQLSYNYICNACSNRRRDADVCRYIARKLADSLRRKGQQRPYPGVAFVRQVVEQCHGQSTLSGNANLRHLCVVLKDVHGGYTLDNVMLVTSGESIALSRCCSKATGAAGGSSTGDAEEKRQILMERMRLK
jgi:hypothetical protein